MNRPKISIVFLCYNQESFVREALTSALDQDYTDFEVIIADDCSTDTTPSVISEVLENHPNSHRAVFLERTRNLGVSGNWNKAVSFIRGELIVCMAGDDISRPERLARIEQAFSGTPEAAAVVSQATVIDASGHTLLSAFESPGRRNGLLSRNDRISAYHFWAEVPVIGASAAYRASMVNKFGPICFAKNEDNALFYRALLSGGVYFTPEPLVLWRWHGSNISAGAEVRELSNNAWLDRMVSLKKDALANCIQYKVDAHKARELGIIDDKSFERERKKIETLEKHLLVSLASEDFGWSYYQLIKAILNHLMAEKFSPTAIKFSFRSLVRPILSINIRKRLARRLKRNQRN